MLYQKALILTVMVLGVMGVTHALEQDELMEEGDIAFLSPTRLKQSPHDVPASVTRITNETIEDLQILKIADLFKYVAGMVSADASGNQPRINYHGTSGLVPRRMQVLLDGVSVYRPSYAEVTWPTLPISIHDVDYVEITRSPSAASYGANSMMAAVNIITKDPFKVDRAGLIGSVGSQSTKAGDGYFSGEVNDNLRYRVSVSTYQDDGYDRNFVGEERRDGTDAERINAKLSYRMNSDTRGEVFIGYSEVLSELEFRDSGQLTFPDTTNDSIFLNWDLYHAFNPNHEIKLNAYYTGLDHDIQWQTCYPTVLFSENLRQLQFQNPEYAQALVNQQFPTGGSSADDALRNAVLLELNALGGAALSPTCGFVNEHGTEKKADIEIQDTWIVSDALRFVNGLGVQRQSLESETFLNGSVDVYAYRVFSNAEYRWRRLVLNAGFMWEDEESHLEESEVSPRVGVNYRVSDDSTLRFVFSKAIRTPDILEHDRNWNYYMRNMTPNYPLDGREEGYFYFNSTADGLIQSEEMISREISFYTSDSHGFFDGYLNQSYDIKVFRDSLGSLVSEKLQFFDYAPTNTGFVTLTGAEIEADYVIHSAVMADHIEKIRLHLNYAYIDNETDAFYERSLHARHSGAAYVIVDLHNQWFSSLSYYGNSRIVNETFDAYEWGLGKRLAFDDGDLVVKGKVVYQPDKENSFVVSDTFNVQNNYENAASYFVTFDYAWR